MANAMKEVPALIKHLDAHREHSTMGLAYAGITDEGCVEVGQYVRDSPFVKYLDLRGNNIQAKGIAAIANGIKLNRSMKTLNLKWNCVGRDPAGIAALCTVLKNNLSIAHVDLRNNRISSVGAKSVADMLSTNTTITHLDLSWNDLGVEGGVALLEGMKRNNALIDCQLSGSKVGEEILHEVAFLLRRNRAAAAYKATTQGDPAEVDGCVEIRAKEFNRTQWTAKDSSALMLRLMMKEREQVQPEDKTFYHQITEHIDKLLLETAKHKQYRLDGEEREKVATAGFVEREQRHIKDIRKIEENLQTNLTEKEVLARDLDQKIEHLRRVQEEKAQIIRDNLGLQEHANAEQVQLRQQARVTAGENRELQDKLSLNQKDLDLLEAENERLRQHVKAFQADMNQILGDET